MQTKDQISLSKMVLVLLVTQQYTGSDVNPKEDFKRTCHKLIKDGSMSWSFWSVWIFSNRVKTVTSWVYQVFKNDYVLVHQQTGNEYFSF